MKIGLLAVQGDFEAHGRMLDRLGVGHVEVKTPADLAGCSGVILPGGESSAQLKFLQEEGLQAALLQFAKDGGAFFGTCAGAILLASEVKNPSQGSLGLMNTVVLRNGYGRQIASEVLQAKTTLNDQPMEMVFIRAPIIESIGKDVEILGRRGEKPVL
ncbi:MAG: pyridoxal 5'-phosphate synthase glutaminase subunit PdxT, partial [Acidobacteria bacterium]|nr:pyridoxal 5'-phosphate synthase glutaminase subunit PdxT [Acidobacteriota bacterium]